MKLPHYFEKFLSEIRPTASQLNDYDQGHKTLRERLEENESLKPIIISTFLQGSYIRRTAVRPMRDKRADVDIIVVTSLNKDQYTPDQAMNLFKSFLDEYYEGKYKKQGRSIAIELSYVDLDLVITSAPSEVDTEIYKNESIIAYEKSDVIIQAIAKLTGEAKWKIEPLLIPDRDTGTWDKTHPLEQIRWTLDKNGRCNTHYINVVKAIKWWQRINFPEDRPSGYPLEHLIGDSCSDGIQSIDEGVVLTLETILRKYADYARRNETPNLSDRGVPEHNVFHRISGDEFVKFYSHIVNTAKIARAALDSCSEAETVSKWQSLFGDKFPSSKDNSDSDIKDNPRGPFITPRSRTGDLTPRRYG